MYPCPLGKYCPEGKDPINCGPMTYRDKYGGRSAADCFTCPSGYWCNKHGMASYNNSACPISKYCPAGHGPIWCPAGRIRPTPGAGNWTDCPHCPGGYYCPYMTKNYTGLPCQAKTYCPVGSAVERDCLAGFYCPETSSKLTVCPGNEQFYR